MTIGTLFAIICIIIAIVTVSIRVSKYLIEKNQHSIPQNPWADCSPLEVTVDRQLWDLDPEFAREMGIEEPKRPPLLKLTPYQRRHTHNRGFDDETS